MKYIKVNHNTNKRVQSNTSFRLKFFLIILGILLPLSSMIFLAIQTSHQGAELRSIEDQMLSLEKENKEIKLEIVENTSLTKVDQEVKELGFVDAEKILYLDRKSPLANLR